jgi:hypothetical protein
MSGGRWGEGVMLLICLGEEDPWSRRRGLAGIDSRCE